MPPNSKTSCSPSEHPAAPDIAAVRAAAERLEGLAVRTPLLESPRLNQRLGGRLLVKAEVLQRTGSFKFRGAYNRISQLSAEQRRRGVVAFSSGNHAQGVAHAAALCQAPAVIVMPSDAPAVKIANTRSYGAEVVLYDRIREDREAIGRGIAEERGAVLVPPFDDPDVIAGQGTVGLEIVAQCTMRGVAPDAVVVPAGGGGLAAGVALAIRDGLPGTQIYSAEPEDFDDHRRSLAAGEILANQPSRSSICDALLSPQPGRITFAVNRRLLAGGLAASDREVQHAMATAFADLKLVVEPGGAVALAAILAGRLDCAGRTMVVVASGGNVEAGVFAAAITRDATG